jgi:hypothetical protein
MRKNAIRYGVIASVLVVSARAADAHGIAGNRFFVGTLAFDDPAVAEEAVLPNFFSLDHLAEGGNTAVDRIDWSCVWLLTPTLQVSIDSGWIHRSRPSAQASGFDTTDIGIKGEIFGNNEHETLMSAGIAWGIGRSGAQGIGAGPNYWAAVGAASDRDADARG